MLSIEVYTIPKCKDCKEAKKYLNDKSIPFKEIDMSIGGNKDTQEMKKFFVRSGFKVYPIFIIKPKDDDEMILPEFDKDIFDKIIEDYNE